MPRTVYLLFWTAQLCKNIEAFLLGTIIGMSTQPAKNNPIGGEIRANHTFTHFSMDLYRQVYKIVIAAVRCT